MRNSLKNTNKWFIRLKFTFDKKVGIGCDVKPMPTFLYHTLSRQRPGGALRHWI